MSKPKPFQAEISAVEQTRNILSNLKGLLRGGTYSGNDVITAVECIRFADHLYNQCVEQLADFKAQSKAAESSAPIEMVSSEELPKPEGV